MRRPEVLTLQRGPVYRPTTLEPSARGPERDPVLTKIGEQRLSPPVGWCFHKEFSFNRVKADEFGTGGRRLRSEECDHPREA
jgi:hypothetical protein